jgi:hypothetical protein
MKAVLLLSTLAFLAYGSSASPAADKKQRCDLQCAQVSAKSSHGWETA